MYSGKFYPQTITDYHEIPLLFSIFFSMFVLFYPLHPQPTGWLETNPNESFAMEHNHHQQTSLFFCGLSKIDQDMDISYIHVYIYIYYHVMNIYHQKHRKVNPKYK